MKHNREFQMQTAEQLQSEFGKTCALLSRAIGKRVFRPKGQVVAAMLDSFMVATSNELEFKGSIPDGNLVHAHSLLLANQEYQEVISRATSDEVVVNRRFEMAMEAVRSLS